MQPDSAANTASSASAASGLPGMIGGLVFYLIFAIWIMKLSEKMGEPDGWWGFIPILNYMQLSRLSGSNPLMGLLYLVPCVNIVMFIMQGWKIAERRGKPGILGALLIVPCIGFYSMYAIYQD